MRRALLFSGGGARGQLQVPVWEHLVTRFGWRSYVLTKGTSIGAGHAAAFATMDPAVLGATQGLWDAVRCPADFQRVKVAWRPRGLYSLKKYRHLMQGVVKPGQLQIPAWVGVVDLESDRYWNIQLNPLRGCEFYDAIVASGSQPLIHEWQRIDTPAGTKICIDGGAGNGHVIPLLARSEVARYRLTHIDVILCSPIQRINPAEGHEVDGALELAGRVIDMYTDVLVQRDLEHLSELAQSGVGVTIYAPQVWPGATFASSREVLEWRRDVLAPDMIANPVTLPLR